MNSILFYDGVGILPVHGFSVQKSTHTSGKPNNSLSPLHHHGAGCKESVLPFGAGKQGGHGENYPLSGL